MPGQDGTGPQGQGPMTGRKMGLCNSSNRSRRYNNRVFRRGRGRGLGLQNRFRNGNRVM